MQQNPHVLLTYDKVHNPLRLPTFRPPGALNHWKNTVFRDFPTFSRICIFFLLTLSLLLFFLLIFLFSLPLPCSAFHLSILSEVWLLNFLRLYAYIPTIAPLFPQSYHHHLPGWRSWKKHLGALGARARAAPPDGCAEHHENLLRSKTCHIFTFRLRLLKKQHASGMDGYIGAAIGILAALLLLLLPLSFANVLIEVFEMWHLKFGPPQRRGGRWPQPVSPKMDKGRRKNLRDLPALFELLKADSHGPGTSSMGVSNRYHYIYCIYIYIIQIPNIQS